MIKKLLFSLIFLAFFVLFSSKASAAICGANGQTGTCPTGFVCENRGSGLHCYAPAGQNCTTNGHSCVSGACPAGTTPGGGLCSGGLTCCTVSAPPPGTTACQPTDCTPNPCTGGQTCTGTKPNPPGTGCSCQGGGGGGGGGSSPVLPPVIVGSSKTCLGQYEKCVMGGNDANGKTCCTGFICKGGDSVDESTHTYEYMCTAIPAPPPAFKCTGTSCSTAVGDVPINVGGFVQKLFAVILGISGGIAVILIIISGYKFMASRGNPEQLQGAREQLTAAIVGLLFIILSLVILQIIGVNILKLPGFTP